MTDIGSRFPLQQAPRFYGCLKSLQTMILSTVARWSSGRGSQTVDKELHVWHQITLNTGASRFSRQAD